MDTRRLHFLLELSRLGSMRAVADVLHTSTSTVSQQIAILAQEMGTDLITPVGRGVRLTPAGLRLAEHAATILASVRRAHLDLDPAAEPTGTVRIAGFATAIRRTVLPVLRELEETHPGIAVEIHEHEPRETFALIAADAVDLALTYDYDLAPIRHPADLDTQQLWTTPWGLGVPTESVTPISSGSTSPISEYRDHAWIGNSRNTADEDALRVLSSLEGFSLDITHAVDNLDLVQDLIVARMGVGLLPIDRELKPGVTILPLGAPGVKLRAYLQIRDGRDSWPPLSLVRDRISAHARRHPRS